MTTFELKELYIDTDGKKRLVLETYEPISNYDYKKMLRNHRVNVMPTYFHEEIEKIMASPNSNPIFTDNAYVSPLYIPKFPRFGNPYLSYSEYNPFNSPIFDFMRIKKVIFNKPATIIIWANGDKTVVKCSKDDIYDPEIGFVMAVIKHDRPDFKKLFKKYYKEGTNNE